MTPTPENLDSHPWDRMEKEPPVWYGRFFSLYVALGPGRSLRAAYKSSIDQQDRIQAQSRGEEYKPRTDYSYTPVAWRSYYTKFKWESRALAYDEYQSRQFQMQLAVRRMEIRSYEWETGHKLLDKVKDMLKLPITKVEVKTDAEGRQITVIEPADWTFRDAASMAEAATRLMRNSLGMSVGTVSVKSEITHDSKPVESISDDYEVIMQIAPELIPAADQEGKNGKSQNILPGNTESEGSDTA